MENVGLMVALAGAMTKAPTAEQVTTAIDAWLDDHPEATTTVQDGAITNAKMATSFVTPGMASAYSTSAVYAVGDYCFHNGSLYRCTTAITTAEAWTAAHWTAAVLGDDVSDLESSLNDNLSYVTINENDYELGTAWASSSSISYGDGNHDAIRTKRFTSIALKKGVIIIPALAKVRLIEYSTRTTLANFVTTPVTIPSDGNYVIVFATADGSTITNVGDILNNIFIINPNGDDYKVIAYEIQKANGNGNYTVDGAFIDVKAQKFNTSKYSFSPSEDTQTGKTIQGMAISNGVIFQGFGNGAISLIDLSNGSVINTYSVSAGHCSSLSFSNEYYEPTDEFPLLYVSSYIEPKTFVVRISRTNCEIVKTYQLPTNKGGYMQQSAINKIDGSLWCIGHKNNSDTTGGAWIVSHWNLAESAETGGIYEPALLDSFEMPFIKWLQCIQCYKGMLVAGVGSNLYATAEDMSRILFVDTGKKSIVSELKDFPTDISRPEIEGVDFVLGDDDKYYIVLSLRSNPALWKVEF